MPAAKRLVEGAPWEAEAIIHCYQNHLKPVLDEGHKAVITLGSVSTRNLLGLSKHKHKQQDWHSIPVRDRQNRFWVIPAFHPAYILRGNHKLTGVNLFAFKNAIEAARNGHEKKLTILRCDPSVEWFAKWIDDFLALEDPPILAIDIETVKKLEGSDESELDIDNAQIVRINFSCDEEEGITVPWSERYIPHIRRLLSHGRGIKAFWNIRYDYPILLRHDMEVLGTPLDFMWGWHILQSSLPRGLGFVSPFYSDFGPWEHLSDQSAAEYGAIDGEGGRCAQH